MINNIKFIFALPIIVFSSYSTPCSAQVSSTVTLVSDYLFNGVSQTDEKPALQASLDWSNKAGVYAGAWASNVDFGTETDIELDGYFGYAGELPAGFSFDIGLAYYSYLGGGNSSDLNYYEVYGAIGYGNTTFKAWYSPDYAGTEAKHYVIALMHTLPVSDNFSFNFQIDKSESLDDELFTWENSDKNYIHWKAEGAYSWQGFDITLGVEGTDLDTTGDTKIVAKIGRTFSF